MGARPRLLAALAGACCSLALAVLPAAADAPARRFALVLAPAEGNLALAKLSFAHAHGRPLTRRALRVALPGAIADDLLAVATPAHPAGAARVALVLLANRPTNLADPASVRLRAASAAGLGTVRLQRLENPLGNRQARPAWLCGLASHDRVPALRALGAGGRPIAGLDAASAVAEAFEIACGLPVAPQLEHALARQPAPAPEPAPPAPEPSPPAPEGPKCAPCNPKPGEACPLLAREAVCVAGKDERASSAAAASR